MSNAVYMYRYWCYGCDKEWFEKVTDMDIVEMKSLCKGQQYRSSECPSCGCYDFHLQGLVTIPSEAIKDVKL